MAELTKEYFDQHYQEQNEFLSEQFDKVFVAMATKDDLRQGFAEQAIKLDFIQTDVASVKKDLTTLSKRTREDDDAFTKELVKLKHRVDTLEKKLSKTLKVQPS